MLQQQSRRCWGHNTRFTIHINFLQSLKQTQIIRNCPWSLISHQFHVHSIVTKHCVNIPQYNNMQDWLALVTSPFKITRWSPYAIASGQFITAIIMGWGIAINMLWITKTGSGMICVPISSKIGVKIEKLMQKKKLTVHTTHQLMFIFTVYLYY